MKIKHQVIKEADETNLETNPIEDVEDTPKETLYKVSYELGNHENWSRYYSTSEEEAAKAVEKFIRKKYPNRDFKVIEVEELTDEMLKEIEEEQKEKNEKLSESLEDISVETMDGPKEGPEMGIASMLNTAIQDELKTIDFYNSVSVTALSEGFEDIAKLIDEINTEENKHVGQLQEALKLVSPNANAIEDGMAEGEEQLSNPEVANNELEEDLDDLSDEEYYLLRDNVKKYYNTNVMGFMHKYLSGDIDVEVVDELANIPNYENALQIDSSDISQGTGNVIVYTYMNTDDGKLYRYASY